MSLYCHTHADNKYCNGCKSEIDNLRMENNKLDTALEDAEKGLLTLKEWCGPTGASMQIGSVEKAVDDALAKIEALSKPSEKEEK